MSLSETQNNCWLVAESNLEKKVEFDRLKSFALLQNCKIKTKKNIVVLRCKKMFLFEKIDKNVQFSFLFLGNFQNVCLCPCKAGGLFI